MKTRSAQSNLQTLNLENRSVEFALTTENAVRTYDWERGVVNEILLSEGVVIPGNKQVPLLDSHARNSNEDVLGSVREIRIENNQLVGRYFFSRDDKAVRTFQKIADGHITDTSAGYQVLEYRDIEEGMMETIGKKQFSGPARIVTKWVLKEASVTPIGADPAAKVRNEQDNKQEVTTMSTTSNEVITEKKPEAVAPVAIDIEGEKTRAVQEFATRSASIMALCREAQVEPTVAEELIKSNASMDSARAMVLDKVMQAQKNVSSKIESVADESDKFREAATDGLLMRSGIAIAKPAAGSDSFRHTSLLRLAEDCLQKSGVKTRNMSSMEISQMALRGAYAITGSSADFPKILRDAANKALQRSYEEYPRMWQSIARTATVSDFKSIYRPQMSEAPDLALIDENGAYSEAKFNENEESYAIATYGKRFTVSRKAIVNDDLSAFTRVPMAFGAAASRKIEKLVFAILTANAAMGDAKALFHADHLNYVTGAATTLSAGTLATAIKAMATQKGFGEDTAYLNVLPTTLIVPWALKFAADIIVGSASYPVADTTYNSGVINPLKGMGLSVVASPLLDLNSEVAWYLGASPTAFDTIEVAFLNGVQAPVLEEIEQMDVDGRVFLVRLDVGAKALDWKGLYKSKGEA